MSLAYSVVLVAVMTACLLAGLGPALGIAILAVLNIDPLARKA